MREIKFRVWIKSTGTMQNNVGFHPHLSMDLAAKDKYYETNEDGRWLYSPSENLVFMQFTGIKNIHVGDIISNKWRCEVYQNEEGTFMVKFHNKPELNKSRSLLTYLNSRELAGCPEDNEVIGNKYENPELLLNTGKKNEAKPLL